jgi:hypothetical protein
VNKNWPNDLRIGYKPFSNLMELIETNTNLDEKLEEFEGRFERMRFWIYNL